MKIDFEEFAARAAPAVFVVLWSTGFIATKYVINNAEPLSYLAIRMAIVVGLMAIIVVIARPKWPDRIGIFHSAVAGILVHGFYLGGTAVAIAHSIPAGLVGADPGAAADPDLDARQPLAWRARHAAAMGRPCARPRRRRADPA